MKFPIEKLASEFRTAIEMAKKEGEFEADFIFSRFPRGCCGDVSSLLGQYLLENNITNIGIFPEGTRSLDGKLGEFKPGSFKIATVAQKPIVIVSMKNTEKIHKNFPFKRTIVEMDIIDVLYDDIRTMNTVELSEKVRNIIDEDLKNEKEV